MIKKKNLKKMMRYWRLFDVFGVVMMMAMAMVMAMLP